jgi:hypothetical protein
MTLDDRKGTVSRTALMSPWRAMTTRPRVSGGWRKSAVANGFAFPARRSWSLVGCFFFPSIALKSTLLISATAFKTCRSRPAEYFPKPITGEPPCL